MFDAISRRDARIARSDHHVVNQTTDDRPLIRGTPPGTSFGRENAGKPLMALRDKKDMQRQLLLQAGIAFFGLLVVLPLFVMFTVSKPTPSIAPSAIPLDGNTCARIGYTTDGYPITPERCLDDIKWARDTMHYANPIDGLYALKRNADERACEMSQRTAQGQDACRRQYR
jgi:hypothetical protein